MPKRSRCMIPGCRGAPHTRGVCHRCYMAAWRRERGKRGFIKRMVVAGLMLPAIPPTPPRRSRGPRASRIDRLLAKRRGTLPG